MLLYLNSYKESKLCEADNLKHLVDQMYFQLLGEILVTHPQCCMFDYPYTQCCKNRKSSLVTKCGVMATNFTLKRKSF